MSNSVSKMSAETTEPPPGVVLIELPNFKDHRGSFVKTFHAPKLESLGLSMNVRESFYSVSAKNVLRGMHFQIPPADHQKLVYCSAGSVLDVLVDLRIDSPRFGKPWSTILIAECPTAIWIPSGIAHGFLSLTERSCVVYSVDHEHSPQHDRGIRWNSFGFEWPCDPSLIKLSDRDQSHPALTHFDSPFRLDPTSR